jgi:putative ATP-dependent endonuclease of OLD family
LSLREIDLSKEDGKSILGQVQDVLPIYALFRADRPSTDQDAEVQDPMKVAIRTALEELRDEVEAIKNKVRDKALEVASRTLDSLRAFDNTLASSLSPEFADPKLDSAFKLTLLGDDGIAVNKRGSGVRRLVLFSFFRAEAARRQVESSGRGIIYAVEEPETAQHPDFQRMVVRSLQELSETDGCQVIATTHSPGLAGLVPVSSLRLIGKCDGVVTVKQPAPDVLEEIATDLGVLSTFASEKKTPTVLVLLEGPNDVAVVQRLALLWCDAGRPAPSDGVDCVFVPAGGQNLKNWVEHRYLASLGLREVHIYDQDPVSPTDPTPKYQAAVEAVNRRNDGSKAFLTRKQAMENYLHWDAVTEAALRELGTTIALAPWGDKDDVVAICTSALRGNKLPCNCKAWINRHAAKYLTLDHVQQRAADQEVGEWFDAILAAPDRPSSTK